MRKCYDSSEGSGLRRYAARRVACNVLQYSDNDIVGWENEKILNLFEENRDLHLDVLSLLRGNHRRTGLDMKRALATEFHCSRPSRR